MVLSIAWQRNIAIGNEDIDNFVQTSKLNISKLCTLLIIILI